MLLQLFIEHPEARNTAFVATVALLYGAFSGIFASPAVGLLHLFKLVKMPLPLSTHSTVRTVLASGAAVSLVSVALVAGSLLSTSKAQAGTGWLELPGLQGDGPVTVLYPTDAANQTINMGPLQPQLAPLALPAKNNGRLVVVSHGSGGSPWVYTEWMDQLVAAGYTVVLPEHAGDNWRDHSKVGPASWALRPLEVSRAIDVVAADPRFAPTLDFKRVGLWGMSAGGHTALTLAGGKWSATGLRDHCQQHIIDDTATCVTDAIELNGGPLDSMKRGLALAVIRGKLADATVYSHRDPRIQAIVAGVPFAAVFDLSTLATPLVPLGIVQAEADVWLKPQFHSGPVLAVCQSCVLIASLPKAGHGALMGPQPPNPPAWLARLIASHPDFDRASLLPMHQNTLAFFQKHLFP